MFPLIPSVESLHKEKQQKDKYKYEIFETVLFRCIQQIKEINSRTEYTFTYFEVPNIIIGSPYYERMTCVKYLMKKLLEKKFKVEFIEPYYLYVDWGSITEISEEDLRKKAKEILKKHPNVSDVTFEIVA